ncbi:MAG: hypothetical protein ACR2MC_05270 [Actinomycetota bacterium]
MAITRDLQLLIAVVVAIAGVIGALAFRGIFRLLALVAGLLLAAYIVGWLPAIDF